MKRAMRCLMTTVRGVGALVPMPSAGAQVRAADTVFVMSNNADRNEVIEFQRNANGTYERSRFDTFGRGTGGVNDPLESQGSLTFSTDRSLLFAANAGSGDVTVFRVHHNTLSFAEKVPSGGSQPVSIAQRGHSVYVLNSGGAGSVVGFTLDQTGHLHMEVPPGKQSMEVHSINSTSSTPAAALLGPWISAPEGSSAAARAWHTCLLD